MAGTVTLQAVQAEAGQVHVRWHRCLVKTC